MDGCTAAAVQIHPPAKGKGRKALRATIRRCCPMGGIVSQFILNLFMLTIKTDHPRR